jgi:hypothetical protein
MKWQSMITQQTWLPNKEKHRGGENERRSKEG